MSDSLVVARGGSSNELWIDCCRRAGERGEPLQHGMIMTHGKLNWRKQ